MIIWGSRTKGEPRGFVLTACPRCGGEQVHFVAEVKTKFTLYFVPTFTYSRKAALVCLRCELRTEFDGAAGNAHIASAISQAEMVAELERRELSAAAKHSTTGAHESARGWEHALAVGMLVAALEVAMADQQLEIAETDALGASLRQMAAESRSSVVAGVAQRIARELPDLIDWIQSPHTPSIAAMLADAGREARALSPSDRMRYFGQVSWLCHQIAEAGRAEGRPIPAGSLSRIDDVLAAVGLTVPETSAALEYCERNGG